MGRMSKRADRRREIEQLFALREREGLSLRELAAQSGIPVGTLSWWSHRLRAEATTPAFTEVRVAQDTGSPAPPPRTDGMLRLRLPGGAVAEFEGELADRVSGVLLESLARWS